MEDLLQKARTYHEAVSSYDVELVTRMVREDYIQHNPRVPTGRAAFLALFPELKRHGTKIENLRIFQDGQHVIMHHLWKNAWPFGAQEMLAFHIILFDETGLIAEHWSAMADGGTERTYGAREVKDRIQHMVFRSGSLNLTISEGLIGETPTAFYDLSREVNDLVTDHWGIAQEIPRIGLANANGMFGFSPSARPSSP